MDSGLQFELYRLLLLGSDLLRDRAQMRFPKGVMRHTDTSACLQMHQGKWSGWHYDWRFSRNNVLKSFTTRRLPLKGETVAAFPAQDRPRSYLVLSGDIHEGSIDDGHIMLMSIMDMQIEKWEQDEIKVHLSGLSFKGDFRLRREVGNKFLMTRGM